MCKTFVATALVFAGISCMPAVSQGSQFAYAVSANSGELSGFQINPVTGTLTPVPGSPYATGRLGATAVAVDPQSRYAYVLDGSIAGYKIDPITGRLTQLPGSPFAKGSRANAFTIDPSGRYLYATTPGPGVAAYLICPETGALTPLPGSPFPVGGFYPSSVTTDPLGRFVYVTDQDYPVVSGFSINPATGALTQIAGSPFTNGVVGVQSLTIDPLDRYAYVAEQGALLLGYSMNAITGVLTPLPGSFARGTEPEYPAVDPRGKFVIAAGLQGLYTYSINPYNSGPQSVAGGLNQAGGPFGTTVAPSLEFPISVTIDYTGSFAYVGYYVSGIIGYKINPLSGALTPIPGSPFATGGFLSTVALARPRTIPVYTAKQIPPLPLGPFASFTASAINNKGEVTGQAAFYSPGEALSEAYLYNGTTTQGISILGSDGNAGTALNDKGEVVGFDIPPVAAPMSALTHAFLYRNSSAIFALDPRVGGESLAEGINNQEHITGSISTGVCGFSFPNGCTGLGDTHAFLDAGLGPKDIGTLGGNFSQGYGINNYDEIVGASNVVPGGPNHVFIYSHGQFHDLGMFDHASTTPTAINDAGRIVGTAFSSSGTPLGFVHRDGSFHLLPRLSGGTYSEPSGLNLQGDIVGTSDVGSGSATHAFLDRDGWLFDLNDLVDPSLTLLTGAAGINNQGQIVATGLNGALYVLTPFR